MYSSYNMIILLIFGFGVDHARNSSYATWGVVNKWK
jgi:hypothetical protein